MEMTSTAFANGGEVPSKYTCEGSDVSPPLAWIGVPSNAKSLALIVDDPDAPDPAKPQRIWVHWVLYNLPVGSTGLGEGASTTLPGGTLEGQNDWKRTGYGGPCPPIGRHRYFFHLYALDDMLPDLRRPNRNRLEDAMRTHIVARAELMGTYQKHK